MDMYKLQDSLSKMSDQQILQLQQSAASGNGQIPPILLDLEVARRSSMRKNEAVSGGLASYADGGVVEGKKWYQFGPRITMPEDTGAYSREAQAATQRGIDALFPPAKDMGTVIDSPLSRSVAELQARRAAAAAAAAQQKAKEGFRRSEALSSGIGYAPTTPKDVDPHKGGIDVTDPTTPTTSAPTPVQERYDVPKGISLSDQKADERAQRIAEIYDQIAKAKEAGLVKPNEEDDAKRAFFRGLAQFGSQLAVTGRIGDSGAAGLKAWTDQMDKDQAAKEAFKKESSQLALQALDDKLKVLNYSDAQRAQFKKEFFDTINVNQRSRELDQRDEQNRIAAMNSESEAKLRDAQAKHLTGLPKVTMANVLAMVKEAFKDPSTKLALDQKGITSDMLTRQYMRQFGITSGAGAEPSIGGYDALNQKILEDVRGGAIDRLLAQREQSNQ